MVSAYIVATGHKLLPDLHLSQDCIHSQPLCTFGTSLNTDHHHKDTTNLPKDGPLSRLRKMCIQIIERYSVCRCIYHRHSIDPCPARAQRGHHIQEKIVYVGYACNLHARTRAEQQPLQRHKFSDSGYSSGTGFESYHKK
jgi:hypothetical protein